MYTTPPIPRYHRTDGWRGYSIPRLAIVGASDTGMEPDSPAPSDEVTRELARFAREVLSPAGIRARVTTTQSSNVFMVKRWLTVSAKDFPRAAELAMRWLDENRAGTHYIHDADLDELRETEEATA